MVRAIYKSNFWNESPTPFRLGLDRKGGGGVAAGVGDHSSNSAAEDKLGRINRKNKMSCKS